jgi:hypothetical protein
MVRDEAELFDELLVYIEGRRRDAHRRFEELARRRTALAPMERNFARDTLRTQAAEISSELVRLRLAESLARALVRNLQCCSGHPRRSSVRRSPNTRLRSVPATREPA